jgi:HAD superfamily phosphatase (TIGR01668 family)
MLFASGFAIRKKDGINTVVFDVDNTVAPYSITVPTEEMKKYLFSLRDAGINVCFASNNKPERLEKFNGSLGFFSVSKAGKPSGRAVRSVMKKYSSSRESTLVVGDQLFTDCLSAHRAGVRAYIVKPIDPQSEGWFVKLKRFFEKPHLEKFRRRRK